MRRVLVWLAATLIRLVGSTLRVTTEDHAQIFNHPDYPPVIIAFWHNRVGLSAYFHERYLRERKAYTFISLSRDGQWMAEIAKRFGVDAIRGSTSRKGMLAALNAIRAARDPRADLVITPDGPRGPRCKVQPGLLRLAQATGRPIVAVTYDLGWKLELNSWDRFQVPLPFATCKLVTRGPIAVPEGVSDEELEAINAKVAEALGNG
jgi:lysophospholipid acyltransferase (LPLAT)-like uncharacterized protein